MKPYFKETVAEEIKRLSKIRTQKTVAGQAEISTAVISQIVNDKHALIADAMWRSLAVTFRIDPDWNIAKTNNYNKLFKQLNFVKQNSTAFAIADNAGKGKSEVYRAFEREHENVILIECKNYWSKKSFVKQLCINSGLSAVGTTEEIIGRFVRHLKKLYKPLVIFDQFDKLKDPQFDLFMDFYNDLYGHCAFLTSGVKALKKRVVNGVNREKIGYEEYYSRVGSKFVTLNHIQYDDVVLICQVNGVDDEDEINSIYGLCEGDLRRVKKSVQIYKRKNKKNAA